MKHIILPIVLLTSALLNSACAPVLVGGAATGVALAHDRRTAGTVLDDQSIEYKTRAAIYADKDIEMVSHINITSYNNIVLLTGETPNAQLKNRAEKIARGVPKVKRVVNEIAVTEPTDIGSRSNDAFITTKVKTTLLEVQGFYDFDPTRVKVITERGNVYLMGLVTKAEGDAVTKSVRYVDGVEHVVKAFEYIEKR
jgi:osmotically-inducible protein OsmY